ncbi:MAG: hypothetical protein KKF46_04570 [Nanoarchaeota archaeon]|nr:hypothetical protein [Nanoarchaeota archaeon]MBU1321610.1 hypothetical protein [Nanoarchaeota archaeon]MBU1597995.1 hypothetical protein [Nanoarchaeota archaeon]MBU2440946.1 hypothetical protein [Nanoarchaeota archaeon]
MFLDVLRGVFSMANVFIALFIIIYAVLFLKKTTSHKERRPWDYLLVASAIYLVYAIFFMAFSIYGVATILGLNVNEISVFFQFIYTGLILLAFISQTDLIFKNEMIIITRKLEPEEKEKLQVHFPERAELEEELKELNVKPKKPELLKKTKKKK